jgi:hypothetical protein
MTSVIFWCPIPQVSPSINIENVYVIIINFNKQYKNYNEW